MNRRTRVLTAAGRRLPRPDPPPPSYLRRARGELPRPLSRLLLGPVSRGIELVDDVLPTEPYAVPVRVYRPRTASGPLPLVVNLHGGGFVFGNLTGADWLCGQLADRVGAVVVSVDYRLAPEHPAPGPYEDAWAATCWLLEHGASFGADPGGRCWSARAPAATSRRWSPWRCATVAGPTRPPPTSSARSCSTPPPT